jgi:hypothetical protein
MNKCDMCGEKMEDNYIIEGISTHRFRNGSTIKGFKNCEIMVVEIVKLCPNCEARILNFIKGKSENEIL